ncbi:hypothetical protein KAZ01_02865 [Candidatus Gracilibacteria bacterium]|nr:hypothetical protein [Candidatus Gracilibacteria bacterium]
MENRINSFLQESSIFENIVSKLYFTYSEVFPKDKNFWLAMAENEKTHSATLNKAKEHILYSNFPEKILNLKIEKLRQVCFSFEEIISKVKKGDFSYEECFLIAIEIENSIYELYLEHFYKENSDNFWITFFNNLRTESIEHSNLIIEHFKKYLGNFEDTLDNFLKISILMEKMCKNFYVKLKTLFNHQLHFYNFFDIMSSEEEMHEEVLKNIYASLSDETLKNKADIIFATRTFFNIINLTIVELNEETDIRKAINLTHKIENSEINVIFKYAVENYVDNHNKKQVILMQLENHLKRLIEIQQEGL